MNFKNFKDFFSTWKKMFKMIGASILLIIAIIIIDALRRKFIGDNFSGKITILGEFKDNITASDNIYIEQENSDLDSSVENMEEISSEFVISLNNSESLGKGSLAVINQQYLPESFYTGLCTLEPDSNIYNVYSPQTSISQDAVPYLNDMMNDYYSITEKNNMIIYNTTGENSENSLYTINYPESISGCSFDLAVNSSYGEIIAYDGQDEESWISENCQNYGFILRYPQNKQDFTGFEYCPYHFRYVGIPHSLIMKDKDLCLEEYTEFIKDYTAENPLKYAVDDKNYSIFYTPVSVPSTVIDIPENTAEYEISGNNYDGYIISYVN